MDRRSFIRKAALGGTAAAASSLAAPALAQGVRTLTMVTSWPVGLSGVWDSVERFSKNVADITDGQLLIDAKGSDQPGAGLQSFDSVSSGQADMYHAADYYFIGQHPGFAYFTAAPFGMTAPEMMTWYYGEDGDAGWRQLLAVAAQKEVEFSVSGVTKDFVLLNDWVAGTVSQALTIIFESGATVSGTFVLSSLQMGVVHNDAQSFDATFMSDGAVTYTPAA
jgi:TRAP-type mannitol/chloroaromatic compound transport system substrate-binding protein